MSTKIQPITLRTTGQFTVVLVKFIQMCSVLLFIAHRPKLTVLCITRCPRLPASKGMKRGCPTIYYSSRKSSNNSIKHCKTINQVNFKIRKAQKNMRKDLLIWIVFIEPLKLRSYLRDGNSQWFPIPVFMRLGGFSLKCDYDLNKLPIKFSAFH